MANGAILRGEVYWVCVDDSVGSEQQTGRPALIISGDKSNEKNPTVIVAYLTTGGFGNYSSVSVNYVGKPERVLCNQVRTIDKQRLTRYMGKLSEPEMRRVSGGLAVCMCIRTDVGAYDDVFEKEDNEEVIALKAELEMWKRSYDIAMTQLVELKVSSDIAMRMARRTPEPEPVVKEPEIKVLPKVEEPEPEKVEESPVVEESESEPERVEINTCTAEDLKRCGCTEVVAKTIIAGRPYMEVDDLRRIPGITSVGFGILKHKVCCVPVKVEEPEQKTEESVVVVEAEEPVKVVLDEPVLEVPKKVNINTATAKEIAEHLSIGRLYPSRIVTHRNKNGKFVDLEELKMVEGLSKKFYDQYKDLLTIGEPEAVLKQPEEPKVTAGKVNINTASAQEICDALGLSKTVCFSICGYRARNGLYKSIEELRQVPRFLESHWEKYKDMVTVGEIESEDEEPKSDKLNINTASLRDLMDVGFEKRAAALIVNERKKYGQFRSVDDLAGIPEISGKILRKLRDKLEV